MPESPNSSHASAACRPRAEGAAGRVEWRPSRLLAAFLALLGPLAAGAVLASEMPRAAAWCLAAAALVHALRLAMRERARAPVDVACGGRAGAVSVDGVPVEGAELHWRGSLAFLRWRDTNGRVCRLAFWPDTLDAKQRRALRLAAESGDVSGSLEAPLPAGEGVGTGVPKR